MAKKYVAFLLSFVPIMVFAQSWEWAKSYGTSSPLLIHSGQSIGRDGQNNIYVTGFSWSPSEATYTGYAFNWLKKFDSQGNIIWSDTIPFYTAETKCATDANGNTYIIGMATIAKFDSNGAQLWLRYIPHATLSGVRFLNGDLIISGYTESYSTTIGSTTIAPMTGFLVRCDAAGSWLWVKAMSDHMMAVDMSVSPENLIFLTTNGATVNNKVQVIDQNGDLLNWFLLKKYGFKKICTDKESNFYVFADISYSKPVIIDDDTIFLDNGIAGKCLLKYNKQGQRLWYRILKDQLTIDDLEVDSENSVYVAGNIITSLQLDDSMVENKAGGVYLAKFKSDGTTAWVRYSEQVISTAPGQLNDMILDSDNNPLITGAITYKHTFGDIIVTGHNNLYSDALIAKIKQEDAVISPANSIITEEGLNIYPNPSNGSFTVSYYSQKNTNLFLSVKNELGQIIVLRTYQNRNSFSETFNLRSLAKGIYFVQLNTDQATEVKKIIIE